MQIIRKMHVKQSTGDFKQYDLGANASSISMDSENTLQDFYDATVAECLTIDRQIGKNTVAEIYSNGILEVYVNESIDLNVGEEPFQYIELDKSFLKSFIEDPIRVTCNVVGYPVAATPVYTKDKLTGVMLIPASRYSDIKETATLSFSARGYWKDFVASKDL